MELKRLDEIAGGDNATKNEVRILGSPFSCTINLLDFFLNNLKDRHSFYRDSRDSVYIDRCDDELDSVLQGLSWYIMDSIAYHDSLLSNLVYSAKRCGLSSHPFRVKKVALGRFQDDFCFDRMEDLLYGFTPSRDEVSFFIEKDFLSKYEHNIKDAIHDYEHSLRGSSTRVMHELKDRFHSAYDKALAVCDILSSYSANSYNLERRRDNIMSFIAELHEIEFKHILSDLCSYNYKKL